MSTSDQKLIGINISAKHSFDDYIKILFNNVSHKLNALSTGTHLMNLIQSKIKMMVFVFSKFGCCPLVYMFRNRRLNNHVNNMFERTLWNICRDHPASFEELLKKDKSQTIQEI